MPEGWNHERLTADIIRRSDIADILNNNSPPIRAEDVVDVAWDVRKRVKVEQNVVLSPWKTLLNEMLTGNTFGADRIDYLLRDSWHAGVPYGRFDPERLIGSLRAVIDPYKDEIALGLDIGGIHAAEALLLARYFMYTQVYMHDVRRVYDLHLQDFLQAWLPDKKFPSEWSQHLEMTDHEVLSALRKAAANSDDKLHDLAARVANRQHFRTVYELVETHLRTSPTIFDDIREFAKAEFGADNVRSDAYGPKSEINDFLVLTEDGSVVSSVSESSVVANVPPIHIGLIFVAPELKTDAKKKIDARLQGLLAPKPTRKPKKEKSSGL